MNQSCEKYREELAALRCGESGVLPADELDAHFSECDDCRAAHDEGGRLFELLDSFQPDPAPEGAARLRLAIATGKYRPGRTESAPRRLIPLPLAALVAAAAFFAALWLGSAIDWKSDSTTEDRTVAVLTGADGLETGGKSTPRPGDPLKAGVHLSVAEDGRASLILHRGARVELAGGSRFELRAADSLYLESGRLLAVVRKAGKPFIVRTPHAEVLTLGTRFTVDAGVESTKVTVGEGRVRFTHLGPGNGSVEVAGRQTSTVLAGAKPSSPAAASAGDLAWTGAPRRRQLEIGLTLDAPRVQSGKPVIARLRLTNRSKSALSVDGSGRGRSSYFVRIDDPAGRRSHFAAAVLKARVDGMRTRAPLVRLRAGGTYELEIDLSAFLNRPGTYRVAAVYLESAATATTDWSGALESGEQVLLVTPAPKKGARVREEMLKETESFRRLIDGPDLR